MPGVEKGASLEGNIELNEADIVPLSFTPCSTFKDRNIERSEISDFGDEAFLLHHVLSPEECQQFVSDGEKVGFEEIRGVRDDYRSCKRFV